ncbi:ABC transporter substrate-binding protein [Bauldia sp.]|uniref:ABC transporter substrate-binding protein n=1 Tax=Bauldia sp. TaxID=2575872 RepID=UPI003BAC66D9
MIRSNKTVGAVCLAAGLAFGIGHASAENLTVYWNAGHAYDTYADVIAEFEADHPGWTVQWEKFQWPDMRTKLVADLAVGNTPDLVAEPGGWVQEFAQQGLLTPLDPYIERDGVEMGYPDDWQEFAVNRNMIDGSYYGVQIHLTCATLVYNVDLLAEAGYDAPPTTWEEFREVAKATTGSGRFGFAPNPVPAYYWPWLFQNGADYYDPETNTVVFDSPEAAEALQFVTDLIHEDQAAPLPVAGADYEGPQRLFTAGRAAMIITGPWDVTPIRTGNPDLNWAIAPSLAKKEQATLAGGVSLMIPAAAEHPDEAWELLKRFVSLEAELAASKANGMTMPRKSWAKDPAVLDDDVLGRYGACLDYARDITAELRLTGKSAEIEQLLKTAIDETVYNNRPAQEVLSEYAERANQILAE